MAKNLLVSRRSFQETHHAQTFSRSAPTRVLHSRIARKESEPARGSDAMGGRRRRLNSACRTSQRKTVETDVCDIQPSPLRLDDPQHSRGDHEHACWRRRIPVHVPTRAGTEKSGTQQTAKLMAKRTIASVGQTSRPSNNGTTWESPLITRFAPPLEHRMDAVPTSVRR
jgi:hypothetical protein